VTAHIDLLPERWRPWAFIPGDLVWLAFNAFVVWQGWLLVHSAIERSEPSLSLQIPMQYVYAVIPLTFLLTCFRLVQFHWRRLTSQQAAPPTATAQL
jgi:TRAP-type C4-dicarboxylate transport system permease small subunit